MWIDVLATGILVAILIGFLAGLLWICKRLITAVMKTPTKPIAPKKTSEGRTPVLALVVFWGVVAVGIGAAAARGWSKLGMPGDRNIGIAVAAVLFGWAIFVGFLARRKNAGGSFSKSRFLDRLFRLIWWINWLSVWGLLSTFVGAMTARDTNLSGTGLWAVGIVVGLLVFLLPIWLSILLNRRRFLDALPSRFIQRANEGDADGTIAELRAIIDIEGPTQKRLHTLGRLLNMRERWSEAIAAFAEVEKFGKPNDLTFSSHAEALEKLGRDEEAFELRRRHTKFNRAKSSTPRVRSRSCAPSAG